MIDHKLYWAPCNSRAEADYLAAILNAEVVNEAIKPFQSTGLLGERDIHKKVLDLPIPRFNPKKKEHTDLANWSGEAAGRMDELISNGELPTKLAAQRRVVRQALGPVMARIEAAVGKLF